MKFESSAIWISVVVVIAWFIWSAKVSNTTFSVAILTYATLTLVLHMLTLVH